MANIFMNNKPQRNEIIRCMNRDSNYDVADSVINDFSCIPDLPAAGISGNPPKVPKIFLSNDCSFNCAYCGCRSVNDKNRYCHSPSELAQISVDEAKRSNHGVFISSAIYRNADYTEELIIETLKIMRLKLGYEGYIHAKIMPGADPELIKKAGQYANRLSVNIEVAKSEGYDMIAKQKNRDNILTPMKQISDMILEAREDNKHRPWRKFATSQTTQLMPGSTNEDDRTVLRLSEAMYKKYRLKRVYYSGFTIKQEVKNFGYDINPTLTPPWRTKRLYQADRLMELYKFGFNELLPENDSFLSQDIDPKLVWALRNMHLFPVEVNTADYEALIRVPGIGIQYAKKIIGTRKLTHITHDILHKIGVSLKRSVYFITCNGVYRGGTLFEKPEALRLTLCQDEYDNGEQISFW